MRSRVNECVPRHATDLACFISRCFPKIVKHNPSSSSLDDHRRHDPFGACRRSRNPNTPQEISPHWKPLNWMSSSPSCWVSTLVPTSRRSPTSVAWLLGGLGAHLSHLQYEQKLPGWVVGLYITCPFSADTVVFMTFCYQRTTMPTFKVIDNSITTPDKRRCFLIPPIILSVILWLMQVKSVPSTFSLLYDAFSWNPGPSH